MILDLFSTMVGSFGTIIIEVIVIGLIMLWALMSTGKKADEQMEEWDCKGCPSYPRCEEECKHECEFFHDDCQLDCDGWEDCDEWEG